MRETSCRSFLTIRLLDLPCPFPWCSTWQIYTPQLDEIELSRYGPACSALCRWLLAMQEREQARCLLEEAERWVWPERAMQRLL